MKGIDSISTSSLTNKYCIKASKAEDSICSSCYSNRLSKFRPTLEDALLRNSDVLSSGPLSSEDISGLKINSLFFRFNSFGELINHQHYENLIRICEHYPETSFSLWTKRSTVIKAVERKIVRPSNLTLVWSVSAKDAVRKPPKGFDVSFCTVTSDMKDVNCYKNCMDCLACYGPDSKGSGRIIIERVK